MAPGQLAGVPKWHAQVIASDTVDTEPCLSVFFESTPSAKYLFGCGESTTRACIQRKYGIKKVKAIFATGVSTERTTGLPGRFLPVSWRHYLPTRLPHNQAF